MSNPDAGDGVDAGGGAGDGEGPRGDERSSVDSQAAPAEARSSRDAVVAALEVPRYGRIALVAGAVFAVAVALFFVGIVSGGRTTYPLAYYVALGFVVFVTSAMLTLGVLVGRRALRLAVHPASIVRRAATGGLLGGLAWLAAAVAFPLGPGAPWAGVVDVATPWAALLTPLGVWAVWTRYKRTTALRPLALLAVPVTVAGALLLADLAAVDLLALLPDVGGPVEPRPLALFRGAAAALVGGGVVLAGLAAVRDGPALPLLALAVAPLLGLGGLFALAPGRLGLAALAAGLGLGWTVACWSLRQVGEAEVPTGPEPTFGAEGT